MDWEKYEERVQHYENQGLARSDAQGVVDAEILRGVGLYDIDSEGMKLHYTGDGWATVDLTEDELILLKAGQLSFYELFHDGREVY